MLLDAPSLVSFSSVAPGAAPISASGSLGSLGASSFCAGGTTLFIEARYHSLFEHMLEGYAYCEGIFDDRRMVDLRYVEVNRAFGR